MTFLCVLFVLCFARPGGAQDRALVARAEAYTAALNARDATKATSFYTEDAVMYGDGAAFVKGRVAILKENQAMLKRRTVDMVTKMIDLTASGNVGYEFGAFSFAASGTKPARSGHYLTIWKKVRNEWFIAYDTFSNDPTPAR